MSKLARKASQAKQGQAKLSKQGSDQLGRLQDDFEMFGISGLVFAVNHRVTAKFYLIFCEVLGLQAHASGTWLQRQASWSLLGAAWMTARPSHGFKRSVSWKSSRTDLVPHYTAQA